MASTQELHQTLSVDVENIGGIEEASAEFSDGVTVLEGRNATNRTSLLRAIMAGLGSDRFTLKGDAEVGRVELSLGDTVVERRFERRNGGVAVDGDGYLDDSEIADLFAFLLEDNEARRAVAGGDDLREILVRPIDTDEIEAEIERLQATRRTIDEKLDHIDERERDLVDLEQKRQRLQGEIEDDRERLEELEAEIDDANTDIETRREAEEELQARLDDLKDHRSDLEEIRFEIETLEETIDSLEAEREDKRSREEELSVDAERDVEELRNSLADRREDRRTATAQMSELQSIIQFNEEMLEGTDSEIAAALRDETGGDDGTLTDQLLSETESVVCWTCGSEVAREDIESTLSDLRSLRQSKVSERRSIDEEIEELNDEVARVESVEDELDEVTDRLDEIDDDIERKRERIESLETRRDRLHEEIADLEDAVEREQSSNYGDLLDLHKEANRMELELERKENDLANVDSEIEAVEALLDEREEYESRRDQIANQLAELRNRIDRLEDDAVSAFNEHMESVLDILEYENLARIWIERTGRETRQGTPTESSFELHIVREADSGESYEGTVDTLSESEREVVGLVFALAGYLVHDVHETVPVMLLDSLEAIDAERIADLVDYFDDYADFLTVALLPEDASAVTVGTERITEI